MNLFSKQSIKNLLKRHKIQPSRSLGQNFLIDKGAAKKVISTAKLQSNDIVLEIGPGLGTLTQELAKKVNKVIAVEKDREMCEILKETLKDFNNIEVVRGDILKISNFQFLISNYKIVANLPFYLTSPVIRKFLESKIPPKSMVLIVQKEVAQRICQKPPDMNLLAVSVQFYAEPKIISYISKKSFWPQPKVDGAIIKITPKKPSTRTVLVDLFFKIVKAGFSQPRKQVGNNLSKGLKLNKPRTRTPKQNKFATGQASSVRAREKINSWLLKNNINPQQRAETLTLQDWLDLTNNFEKIV